MTFPSEHDFALLLFQLSLILGSAFALGAVARRFGQPAVIGEVLAGVLLGPSILGALAPQWSTALFPAQQTQMLGTVAWLGSVFLLLVTGMEINLAILRQEARAIVSTSIWGIVLPSITGFLFAWYLPDNYLVNPAQRWVFCLLMATAMSISAIPMVAKILLDMKLLKTPVGHVIIGAAVVNDLIGWTFFAVILSIISERVAGPSGIVATVLLTMIFAGICLTGGRVAMGKLFARLSAKGAPEGSLLGLTVLIAFLCAALAQWIGIHAVFGAYLAGVMISEAGKTTENVRETLETLVLYVFAPLFFATMGQRANFIVHFDPLLVFGVLIIACIGKIVGGTLGARWGGMSAPQAMAVGFGLNARGAMEIILAFLALDFGLINEKVYVALVVTAIVTSIISGPLIRAAMKRQLSSSAVRLEPIH